MCSYFRAQYIRYCFYACVYGSILLPDKLADELEIIVKAQRANL